MRKHWLLILAALTALTILTACGVKTPPLPAEALLPSRVSQPSYVFTESGLLKVYFKPPQKDVQGGELKDLAGFYIDRSENKLTQDFCPGCPVEYTKRIRIAAADPPFRGHVADRTYSFEDDLKPGYSYHYRIQAYDSGGDFDPAQFQTLVVFYDSPSRPPESLDARTEDGQVMLSWSPPAELTDGRPAADVVGYHIFRRAPGGSWTRLNLEGPWKELQYQDSRTQNDQVYEYKIRTVREWRGTVIEGPPSSVVTASPRDLTPPPPPVNVYAVSTKEGVRLGWIGVEAPDLAGYRVYRRRESETEFKRVGPDLVSDTQFMDGSVRPGEVYFYRVTSVDSSPAANESRAALEVKAIHEP